MNQDKINAILDFCDGKHLTEREAAEVLRGLLITAFVWDQTPPGGDFWSQVSAALHSISGKEIR
jgi:hypothetical protein